MIHLDTSVLVDALTGPRRSAPSLRRFIERGERIQISAIVLYEWLRGPRRPEEIEDQETLFPRSGAVGFGAAEAAHAARLYGRVTRPRGREIDLAIAASAIVHHASLWTLNSEDFSDIPGLTLAE
jgi:predicted nucleic acid-binding protein